GLRKNSGALRALAPKWRSSSTAARRSGSPAHCSSRNAPRRSGARSAACWNKSSTASGDGSGMSPPFSGLLAQPLHQPRPDVPPVPVERALGQPEDRRGLVPGQAGEIAQQDDLGLERVAGLEFLQGLVDREHVVRGRLEDGAGLVQLFAPPAAAPLGPGLAARL